MMFANRKDIGQLTSMIYAIYKRLECTIHIRCNNQSLKTVAIIFPSRKNYKPRNNIKYIRNAEEKKEY